LRSLSLGYWVAQEQYPPDRLLEFATHAYIIGFDSIVTSDHFHPWRDSEGHAGHPWVWLTAAAERLKGVEVGTAVTTPLYRYHPAVVAQAFATLDYLYPGRVFLTVGTGHAMNEVPLGFQWPRYAEKVGRLREAVEIIRLLWRGGFVDYEGKYYRLVRAKLYTPPRRNVRLYIATADRRVAEVAGEFADGILTNPRGMDRYEDLIRAMIDAARRAGRDPGQLSKCLEFKVSYDPDFEKALKSALYWAPTAIPRELRERVADPRELEAMAGEAEAERIRQTWLITSDSDDIYRALGEFLRLGFDRVFIHSSSPDEEKFLNLLGREILPWVREYYESLKIPIRISSE